MRTCTYLVATILVCSAPGIAEAQFFLGVPSSQFDTTSGTINNTPAVVTNQLLKELDVNGQLIIQNATPLAQTASFTVTALLDPTYNSGNISNVFLQINQSGFVTVPAGGLIYGWTLTASIILNDGTAQPTSTVVAQWPQSPTPYGPGTTNYGPTTTLGALFSYDPTNSSMLELTFTSTFDGLIPANTYLWDFPASVQVVPEPTSLAILATGATLFAGYGVWRRRRS
jgi:hypothetical protein